MQNAMNKNGVCKSYHDNGQLREQCVYKDGKREGECKYWYENVQLREQCFYTNGQIVDLSDPKYEKAVRKIWYSD